MPVRTIVVSDLHFGDPYGCDLLRYDWVRDRFWPLVDGADRLILLGDTWELAFQNLTVAVQASRPFFEELAVRFPGLTLMVLPGNHDHHLVVSAADERRERQALGLPEQDAFVVAPAERILRAISPGLQIRSAYPVFAEDGFVFTHGHYLSSHLEALGWQSFDRLSWWIWRQQRRRNNLSGADYEALMTPLYELCHQVAQLPDGVHAQKEIERTLGRLGQLAGLPGQLSGSVGRLVGGARERFGHQPPEPREPPPVHVDLHPVKFLQAVAAVAANLGLREHGTHLVFGHTHTPIANACIDDQPHWTFHNSGSFFYDYREAAKPGYWQRCWPGSALEITDGVVTLQRLLLEEDLADFRTKSQIPQAQEAARRARVGRGRRRKSA